MLVIFGLFAVAIVWSAAKITAQKTGDIDKIITTIEFVQTGNFDQRPESCSNDEFLLIERALNKMMQEIKRLIAQNAESAIQQARAEIKLLETQFNPHFLFNTLETIKYLSRTDTKATTQVIVSLSALLRYGINNSIITVTLAEDIEYTKNYLLIQKCRFGNKLEYTFTIAEDAAACIVPKLIIQPLIENSIKYSYGFKQKITVVICARIADGKLFVTIEDNGIGMTAAELNKVNEGMKDIENVSSHNGLHNTNRRIKLLYGDDYGLVLQSEKNLFTLVSLIMPIGK